MRSRTATLTLLVTIAPFLGCDSQESRAKTALDHFVQAKEETRVAMLQALSEKENASEYRRFELARKESMVRLNTSGKGGALAQAVLREFESDIPGFQTGAKFSQEQIDLIKSGPMDESAGSKTSSSTLKLHQENLSANSKALEIHKRHQAEVLKLLEKP